MHLVSRFANSCYIICELFLSMLLSPRICFSAVEVVSSVLDGFSLLFDLFTINLIVITIVRRNYMLISSGLHNKQHHKKGVLKSLHLNGHTSGFHPQREASRTCVIPVRET